LDYEATPKAAAMAFRLLAMENAVTGEAVVLDDWGRTMIDQRWMEYERMKKKLVEKNLSPKEYEKAIREIAKRLGV
jgi:hypothetical protein